VGEVCSKLFHKRGKRMLAIDLTDDFSSEVKGSSLHWLFSLPVVLEAHLEGEKPKSSNSRATLLARLQESARIIEDLQERLRLERKNHSQIEELLKALDSSESKPGRARPSPPVSHAKPGSFAGAFPWTKTLRELLQSVFGFTTFRQNQVFRFPFHQCYRSKY